MANLSEDIQCAGSDTRPPMLDRTDFASWQQCIRLYYRGKENGMNILKLIDEGPFQMGTFQETLVEGHMRQCEDAPGRVGNANPGQARHVKYYNSNGGQNNAIDEDMDE
ncbi:hypothetical protein Tco_1386420 [Tanacetum coccineum]